MKPARGLCLPSRQKGFGCTVGPGKGMGVTGKEQGVTVKALASILRFDRAVTLSSAPGRRRNNPFNGFCAHLGSCLPLSLQLGRQIFSVPGLC